MEFTLEQLEDMVRFCGGHADWVDLYIDRLKNKQVTNLTELSDYHFKKDYDAYVINDAPNLKEYFYRLDAERYRIYNLDGIIEDLGGEASYKHSEDDDFDNDMTNEEIVDKYFPEIAKELIELKFGSMEYDW